MVKKPNPLEASLSFVITIMLHIAQTFAYKSFIIASSSTPRQKEHVYFANLSYLT